MPGGRRPGAGRPKGAKNKRSSVSDQLKREIKQSGRDPVEYMLWVMEHDKDDNRRLEAAKGAAPYIRAKLSQADITHHNAELTDEEAEGKLDLLANTDLMAAFITKATSTP